MNYTDKYHLPQWEKSDRVLMDDFNQAMNDIEAGLEKNAQDAAAGTSSAVSAAANAAAKAQSTADNALAAANNAQSTADQSFKPGYLPYAVGMYTGNGSTITLYLGFQPRFAIVTRQSPSSSNGVGSTAVAGVNGAMDAYVHFNSTGMTISAASNGLQPELNYTGITYSYIAFR